MIYCKLFWAFFQIGLFSIGGGYAALPLVQNQVVDINKWITMKEYTDIITISQMTPGPIAINTATFVGMQIKGISGAVMSTLGCILPSCIIVIALSMVYIKNKKTGLLDNVLYGLRPAVVGMITAAGASVLISALWSNGKIGLNIDYIIIIIISVSLFFLRKTKINPIFIMMAAGTAGVLINSFN